MTTTIDKLTADGCSTDDRHKVCRSRGGESCAFDGAMIVLQPIADTAHLVHGPIACCGNSWEGRGTRSSKGDLHAMGFTTDMGEIDIVYGSDGKLRAAIEQVNEAVGPRAIFVYSTCVSGLIGEDIDAVCKQAEAELGVRVIPVNAPGFVGPKNLGNRVAGEVLLDHVIGTGESPVITPGDINLIGEYNIAGDLWEVEPLLARAGMRVLSRITGDASFAEITWAHQAKLNVVVCSRALINVAREMERKYGIPFVEVSFFGSTEIAKALRAIGERLNRYGGAADTSRIETVIRQEEKKLKEALKPYRHLRGRNAVLYTGGVKSWSFISALLDLGIGIAAVGTKKSTVEDEEKMQEILGPAAPLVEDVTPKNLRRLMKERNADILVAGGRNQYLAVKEGYPFVDVNQERHVAYAGFGGLVNLARQISNSLRFYRGAGSAEQERTAAPGSHVLVPQSAVRIDPLKHSPAIGAAMAFQGIDGSLPVIHGAQGCTFLGKVLLTKHFQEPIALAGSKLFVEEVVMGSEEKLAAIVEDFIGKNGPRLVAVLSSGLTEVKGDDMSRAVEELEARCPGVDILSVATPDYDGGLEKGYARAVEAIVRHAASRVRGETSSRTDSPVLPEKNTDMTLVNIIAGPHLTPADFSEVRDLVESFGMDAVILPDLSALDGSRQVFSPLASGGTDVGRLGTMADAALTLAIGPAMEPAARLVKELVGVEYRLFDGIAGLADTDAFLATLAEVSGRPVPARFERRRRVLTDAMRDAHPVFGGRKICLALDPDHAVQMSKWLVETGAVVDLAVIPALSDGADRICAREVRIGDLHSIEGSFDLLIANSHAERTAKRLGTPHFEAGFPVFKSLGYPSKVMTGYRGTMGMIHEAGNLMMKSH